MPARDAIVMAFGDAVVPKLKGVAKAIYSGGRFLVVADGTAVFALDNAPTVDRAEKYRPAVEELLAAELGATVPIRLVTEADADSYGSDSATSSSPASDSRKARGGAQGPAADAKGDDRTQDGGAAATPAGPAPSGADARNDRPRAESGGEEAEPSAASGEANPSNASEEEAELVARVDELEIADVSTRGVDKLTDAFPGAEFIETEDKQ